jgi:radical SAM superfamily enzyme YgiQ (UPF0313 family)
VVIGEAEEIFPRLLDDYRHGRPERVYRAEGRPARTATPDRSIFQGKRYLPLGLVEFARGCRFRCDFCAITAAFQARQTHRPVDRVIEEVQRVRRRGQMIFFVDDNITSDLNSAKELMRALIPLKIRWVSQSAINVAYDDEALDLMKRSGCQGVLVGFESLDEAALAQMNKRFNLMKGGPAAALERFRAHGLRIYGTFIFGYDHDTPASFRQSLDFAGTRGSSSPPSTTSPPFPAPRSTRASKERGGFCTMPGGSIPATATARCPSPPGGWTPGSSRSTASAPGGSSTAGPAS